ncbi:hypothetical protein A3709_19685 [Halioglobus sp. HI00S01]|uniref:thioredoxin domain-containing protein n=1 Tax=Halioglobus sp. HI00S01 TaxID=1822214 RepID=UPI0007C2791A|nr:thioredoxin domain-containing protein [Halioglobus sp. HI00S01]KZX57848.1 hypothetical protein A3709_19685 [Halioglobus sp. HI00S01]
MGRAIDGGTAGFLLALLAISVWLVIYAIVIEEKGLDPIRTPAGTEHLFTTNRNVHILKTVDDVLIEGYQAADGRWVITGPAIPRVISHSSKQEQQKDMALYNHDVTQQPGVALPPLVLGLNPDGGSAPDMASGKNDARSFRELDAVQIAAVQAAHYVSVGSGDQLVYVFFDMKCPGCKAFHSDALSLADSMNVTFRYLPVAILGPDSLELAAMVLGTETQSERLEAFDRVYTKHQRNLGEGLSDEFRAGTERALLNWDAMVKVGALGTPSIVFPASENGDAPILMIGATKDRFIEMARFRQRVLDNE